MSYDVTVNPVWKSGPKICEAENLPALPSLEALYRFLAKNAPSCKVLSVILNCPSCGQFHARTSAPDPAGGSSGTGRSSKE